MSKSSEGDVGKKSRRSKRKDDFQGSPRPLPKKVKEVVTYPDQKLFGGWRMLSKQILPEPTGSSEGREGELRFESPSPSVSSQQTELTSTETDALPSEMERTASISPTSETVPSTSSLKPDWSPLEVEILSNKFQKNVAFPQTGRGYYYPDSNGGYSGSDSNPVQVSPVPGRPLQHHRSRAQSYASRMSALARRNARSLSSHPVPTYGQSTETRYYEAPSRESLLWKVDPAAEQTESMDRISGSTFPNTRRYMPNALTSRYTSDDFGQEPSPLEDFRPLQPDFEFGSHVGHFNQMTPESALGGNAGHFNQMTPESASGGNAESGHINYHPSAILGGNIPTSTMTMNPGLIYPSDTGHPQHGASQQPSWTEHPTSDRSLLDDQFTTASSSSYPYPMSAMEGEMTGEPDPSTTLSGAPAYDMTIHSYGLNPGYQYSSSPSDHSVPTNPQRTYHAHFDSPIEGSELENSQLFASQPASTFNDHPHGTRK
ncbi:hypothetical protein LENED_008339 [Lentinula edodes]|uniref:Uncharacterized protein n=1 Tax=Lentinula edodes TaxID=5353 RepID=A0A1Q3EGU6_LENED|nr:hypothetical protein LENED_008339 [Lentinula edodes]